MTCGNPFYPLVVKVRKRAEENVEVVPKQKI